MTLAVMVTESAWQSEMTRTLLEMEMSRMTGSVRSLFALLNAATKMVEIMIITAIRVRLFLFSGFRSHIESYLLLQRIRQCRTFASLDQEGCHFGNFSERVMLTQRPFEIACATGATRSYTDTDHAAHHHEVTIA